MMLLLQLFLSFMKIGFCSFGGMTMIPVIKDEVFRYGWMTADEVMDIVAVAEMTPGSLGINSATFVGLRSVGIVGALAASLGVMMPSLTLSMLAAHFILKMKGNPWLESAMRGIRPASLGMLVAAGISLGIGTYVSDPWVISWNMVLMGAVGLFLMLKMKLSIPKVILIVAAMGLFFG